jgi:hypothetical protein
MRISKLTILLWPLVLMLAGCPDKPTPWTPDGRTDTDIRADGTSSADGQGNVDGVSIDSRGPTDTEGPDGAPEDQTAVPDILNDQTVPTDAAIEVTEKDVVELLDEEIVDLVKEDIVELVEEPDIVELVEEDVAPDVQCVPACDGKECGPDGCGGECGACEGEKNCVFDHCVKTSGTCDDGNMVNWDGCTEGFVSEIQLNQIVVDDQRQHAVTAVGESFVVVYESCPVEDSEEANLAHDGWGCGVFGRRIFPGDLVQEPQFPVNVVTQQDQGAPDIATLGENLVVSWLSAETGEWQLKLRVFTDAGEKLSQAVSYTLKSHEAHWRPAIAASGNEQILVAWFGIKAAGNYGLLGQYFHFDGESKVLEAVGDTFEMNQVVTVDAHFPRVASVSPGIFVAAWGATLAEQWNSEAYGLLLTYPNAPLSGELVLNTGLGSEGGQDYPDVASFGSQGGFVAVYEDNSVHIGGEAGLVVRKFGADGIAPEPAKTLIGSGPHVSLPSIAEAGSNGFFVAWGTHFDGDDSPWQDSINVMGLAPDLELVSQSQANLYVADYQKFVRVATNQNTGHSIVVWESCPWDQFQSDLDLPGQDGDGCGIFARIYEN